MKTVSIRLALICSLSVTFLAPLSFAQRQLEKKRGPTSKIYLAETSGDSQIQNGDRIYTAHQATTFDAAGTEIETKENSLTALVYSNGTGMFVDQNTRVKIDRFTQDPFLTGHNDRLDSPYEPSISHSTVLLLRGAIGICTNQLVSGSSMQYSTPHVSINIRGGRISIESNAQGTVIDLLDGDMTVRNTGGRDIGGQILLPGERATIKPDINGGDSVISVGPIPPANLQAVEQRVAVACNARKSVTFEIIEKRMVGGLALAPDGDPTTGAAAGDTEAAGAGGGNNFQEIVAKPTVPSNPPSYIVVSPDRLPGT